MKTILEIANNHFRSPCDYVNFCLWAFGDSNLTAYSNCQLIEIWNNRHGEIATFRSHKILIYIVMEMLYIWNVYANNESKDSAEQFDAQMEKEKRYNKYIPIVDTRFYSCEEMVRIHKVRIDDLCQAFDNIKKVNDQQDVSINGLKARINEKDDEIKKLETKIILLEDNLRNMFRR